MSDTVGSGYGCGSTVKALLTLFGFVLLLVGMTYLWQGLKLQYTRDAKLTVAMLDGEITEAEHEALTAENTLIWVMLTEPAAVWAVD